MEEKFRVRRHRITILQRIYIPFLDLERWQKVCQAWAELRPGLITIRYQKNLWPGQHVVAGFDRFKITAVIDRPGKTRLVELQVQELRASTDPLDAPYR